MCQSKLEDRMLLGCAGEVVDRNVRPHAQRSSEYETRYRSCQARPHDIPEHDPGFVLRELDGSKRVVV